MKRSSLFALLLAGFTIFGAVPGPGSAAYNLNVLNEVWSAVARNHYSRDFDKTCRANVYEKFKPQVMAARDIPELVRTLNGMLQTIGDSHLRLHGPAGDRRMKMLQTVEQNGDRSIPSDPGFTVIPADRRILVWKVRPGSDAAKAGVKPGDELLAVNGTELLPEDHAMPPRSMLIRAVLESGGAGSGCAVRLRDAAGKIRDLRFTRSAHGGKFFRAANLPTLVLHYQAEMLNAKTGYIQFNFFTPETVRMFRNDLRHGVLKNAENLILDLRGNPGGFLLSAELLSAWCAGKPIPLGTLEISGVRLTPVSEPQKGCFKGRLAVLTDRDTMSTGELFAAAIQDAGAGIIIGETTPGYCLPSIFLDLKCGFRLQTVSGKALRPKGQSVEKNGVHPDIMIANGFTDGRDRTVEAALKYFGEKKHE